MADVKIRGLDALLHKLGTLKEMERELRPWAERALTTAEAETNYTQGTPPRRPGQTYVRTFRLRNDWQNRIDISGGAITVQRYNNRTPYGTFVMGRSQQAGAFRGRWPTDASIEQKIAPKIIADLERTISEVLEK